MNSKCFKIIKRKKDINFHDSRILFKTNLKGKKL